MFVLSNTAPPVGTTCTFTGDPSQLSQSAGTISWYATELGQGYLLSPLIESRITTTNDDQIPQRTIHLEGANITATAQPAGTNQKYTALFAGSIVPGGTANVSFEALPASSIMAFNPAGDQNVLVVLDVQVYGTLGGSRIDADHFQYPVTIIGKEKGIVFGAGASTTTGTLCSDQKSVPRTGNACNPTQDGVVDCCRQGTDITQGGTLICPAIPE